MSIVVITIIVVAIVVGATAFGIFATLKIRRRFLDSMQRGMQQGAAAPGHDTAPRGVGGLTAAQTTAMATEGLNAFPGFLRSKPIPPASGITEEPGAGQP